MMVKQGFSLLCFISVAMTMEIPAMQCERDSDCEYAAESSYCLPPSCETCIPCEQMFNRQPPPLTASGRPGCAILESDCGECLPNHQHEDLTDQRYSIKCYPKTIEHKNNEHFEPLSHPPGKSIGAILTYATLVTLMTFIVAFGCFVSSSCDRTITSKSTRVHTQDKHHQLDDRPHEEPEYDSGVACTSEQKRTLMRESDFPNPTTPINHYHPTQIDLPDMDKENGNLNGPGRHESQPVSEEGNETTETFPSLSNDPESNSRMETQNGAVKFQSQKSPATRRPASHRPSTRSRSDPMLPTQSRRRNSTGSESYAHRNAQLPMHCLPIAPLAPLDNETVPAVTSARLPSHPALNGQCQEHNEPNEPQALLLTSVILPTLAIHQHPLTRSMPENVTRK
ncbi:uncharacterized protein LOC130700466 [Daphnia carinata]|uniref:uncharacterized protein LOC130700466 n=1 Tax=Daphnia carinata TaxID=120202 RepID=UPI00257FB46E|nr:uncharacterized protein LOC130700466 [Daphnia carinata]